MEEPIKIMIKMRNNNTSNRTGYDEIYRAEQLLRMKIMMKVKKKNP